MDKTFTIPAHDVRFVITQIHISLDDDMAIVNVASNDVGDNDSPNVKHVQLKISEIFTAAITKGDITNANVNAFEKCWKLLAAKAIKKELSDLI